MAPSGWKEKHNQKTALGVALPEIEESPLEEKKKKSVWARLIRKVYGVDTLLCPGCGSEMKILSVIFDHAEIKKILTHLVNIGRAPPHFDPNSLN